MWVAIIGLNGQDYCITLLGLIKSHNIYTKESILLSYTPVESEVMT